VPNPSFEEYWECPTGNDLNDGQLEKCKYWWKPTYGTSDYFNRCHTNGIVDVPYNFWGHQEPFHGDGYVGLVPICWLESGASCGHEYIQTKLNQALKPCTKYKFQMYVSLAEESTHSIGKLGAAFTQSSIQMYNDNVFDVFPQVVNQNGILHDSVEWLKIEAEFIANGLEEYLTIGYFFPNPVNDTFFIQDYFIGSFAPYYYIDSVSLFEIETLSDKSCSFEGLLIPNVFTPNNDGANDIIDISKFSHLNPSLQIINRWGNVIINLDSTNLTWDGTSMNGHCNEGVYYYLLNYFIENREYKQTGFIQLIRN